MMQLIGGLFPGLPARGSGLRLAVLGLALLGYSPALLAAPRISVTPMIQRLSDEDRRSRSLVVSTQIVIAEPTRIHLALVRPSQQKTGRVDWVGDTSRRPLFSLPFTDRLLSKGVHTLSFTGNLGTNHQLKPLRFAVAITYGDREIQTAGPGQIKLKADVRLRQIFQITHPGSLRGARRYQVSVDKSTGDQKGFMTLVVTNRTEAPFYLKATAHLSAHRSGRRPPTHPRPMFLLTDGADRGGRVKSEVTLYPHSPVQIVADFRDVAPGDYRAKLAITMRDRLGKRSDFIARDFQKRSPAAKAPGSTKALAGLGISVDHSRHGTVITLTGHDLGGSLRLTTAPDNESCKLRASRILVQPNLPARIVLARVRPSVRCVITATHRTGEVRLLLQGDRARVLE
jgi:hypothetical protein